MFLTFRNLKKKINKILFFALLPDFRKSVDYIWKVPRFLTISAGKNKN